MQIVNLTPQFIFLVWAYFQKEKKLNFGISLWCW